ncbi:MAG: phosphoenolpyruvate carboxylase, partial [Planctomycetes bacterium]|nr:phosphoenolpyruvate carboxylase [Planctomycetota bacterium]
MTEEIHFPDKDRPLRDDVSGLGALLGQVLRTQGGEPLFERVERARKAARRRRRRHDADSEAALDAALLGLEPAEALATVQAFSTWFELVNLAERIHRVRRRQDYGRGDEPQPASLEAVFRQLAGCGAQAQDVATIAQQIVIEPVFTAHPTEAVRPAILAHEQRIARVLLEGLAGDAMTRVARAAGWREIKELVSVVWQTEEHRAVRPTVADELEHVLFYVTQVFYEIAPDLEDGVRAALKSVFDQEYRRSDALLRCATWVGGDMDGNPNVGPDTIRATTARQRALIIDRYRHEVLELAEKLTQSRSRVAVLP